MGLQGAQVSSGTREGRGVAELVMITRGQCAFSPRFPAGDLSNQQKLVPDWFHRCVRWFCLLTTYYVPGTELRAIRAVTLPVSRDSELGMLISILQIGQARL